jgi:hypothetical protein
MRVTSKLPTHAFDEPRPSVSSVQLDSGSAPYVRHSFQDPWERDRLQLKPWLLKSGVPLLLSTDNSQAAIVGRSTFLSSSAD